MKIAKKFMTLALAAALGVGCLVEDEKYRSHGSAFCPDSFGITARCRLRGRSDYCYPYESE